MDYPDDENETSLEVSSLKELLLALLKIMLMMKVRDDIVTLEPITQKEALKVLLTLHNLL